MHGRRPHWRGPRVREGRKYPAYGTIHCRSLRRRGPCPSPAQGQKDGALAGGRSQRETAVPSPVDAEGEQFDPLLVALAAVVRTEPSQQLVGKRPAEPIEHLAGEGREGPIEPLRRLTEVVDALLSHGGGHTLPNVRRPERVHIRNAREMAWRSQRAQRHGPLRGEPRR